MTKLGEFFQATHTNLHTVFYPTHFVFASFRSGELAEQAQRALVANGFLPTDMHVARSEEVKAFFDEFRSEKGAFGKFMRGLASDTEAKYCDLNMERAQAGAGFVAVRCLSEEQSHRIQQSVREFSPLGVQWYRSIVIVTLASAAEKQQECA
ncbi:MAG: hypothetical protein NVS1B11_24560 [Terriglobales bacterium]